MIYIEYFSRRAGVSVDNFHRGVIAGQSNWEREHPEDKLVWSAGRTWRMGPGPGYIGAWWTPGPGFGRIDYWDKVFRSGNAGGTEDAFQNVATIDVAGCYEPLIEPVVASHGTYYAEFFRMTADASRTVELYRKRRAAHGSFTLNMLVNRIGRLGPEPGGLAVWTVPSFASLTEIASELVSTEHPLVLVAAGTYADVGSEIL